MLPHTAYSRHWLQLAMHSAHCWQAVVCAVCTLLRRSWPRCDFPHNCIIFTTWLNWSLSSGCRLADYEYYMYLFEILYVYVCESCQSACARVDFQLFNLLFPFFSVDFYSVSYIRQHATGFNIAIQVLGLFWNQLNLVLLEWFIYLENTQENPAYYSILLKHSTIDEHTAAIPMRTNQRPLDIIISTLMVNQFA